MNDEQLKILQKIKDKRNLFIKMRNDNKKSYEDYRKKQAAFRYSPMGGTLNHTVRYKHTWSDVWKVETEYKVLCKDNVEICLQSNLAYLEIEGIRYMNHSNSNYYNKLASSYSISTRRALSKQKDLPISVADTMIKNEHDDELLTNLYRRSKFSNDSLFDKKVSAKTPKLNSIIINGRSANKVLMSKAKMFTS